MYYIIITYYYIIITSSLHIITSLLRHYYVLLRHSWLLRHYCILLRHYYVIIITYVNPIITSLLHHYYIIIMYYYGNNICVDLGNLGMTTASRAGAGALRPSREKSSWSLPALESPVDAAGSLPSEKPRRDSGSDGLRKPCRCVTSKRTSSISSSSCWDACSLSATWYPDYQSSSRSCCCAPPPNR